VRDRNAIIKDMNEIYSIPNLFSEEELKVINDLIDSVPPSEYKHDKTLGRGLHFFKVPDLIFKKLSTVVNDELGLNLALDEIALYAEYSAAYGEPNLNPHFDADWHDLIIDYQLESNTSWDLGVNLKTYPVEDNSSLVFNANTNIHWRPYKTFIEGEYIKMLFFRCYNPIQISDYSHVNYPSNDPIYDDVQALRDRIR
jgi:hypothetical protein